MGKTRPRGRATHRPPVVHPVDSPAAAVSSLAQAVAIARLYQSELHLVLAARPSRTPLSKWRGGRAAGEADRTDLSALRELVAGLPDGSGAVRIAVAQGLANAANVSDYARATAAALVVVSASYRASPAGRQRTLVTHFGRSAPCPLMVLPRPPRGAAPRPADFVEILCAIDHKAASDAALKTAVFLARQGRGRLTLLHAVEGFPGSTTISGMRALRLVQQYKAFVAAESRRLERAVPGGLLSKSRIRTAIVAGDARRAILHTAARIEADLIVMGVVPRNLFEDILIGSTSRVVLRRAACPVILVPALATTPMPWKVPERARRPV